ncbi:MAG: hypothetical protein JBO36_04980 [Candidatus Thiodiazotropha taylori]|nr:hypothetical protein [Candidatus Thiodiazotropha taylori]
MSWRDTLGVIRFNVATATHNSHNAQKPLELSNCENIANYAHRDSEDDSYLLEKLAEACRDLKITPSEVRKSLTPEDIENWRNGEFGDDTLVAIAQALVQRKEMNQGKRPAHYTKQATCQHCGPIWLWFSGKVQGCPWCWNRVAERSIPRPCSVQCGNCHAFERSNHPHLGYCTKGVSAAIAGLWDTDRRYCDQYLPSTKNIIDDQ